MNPTKSYADWGFPEENDVVMLDIFSHDRFLAEYPEAMVYYFIADCDHCVSFKPIYHRLGLEFKETKRRVPLAQFDCTEHLNFCKEHLIPVFPFIKFFVKGHPILYTGKRDYVSVRKYLKYMATRRPDKMKMEDLLELYDNFFDQSEIDTSLFTGEELKAEINLRQKRKDSVLAVYFGNKSKNKKLFNIFDLYFKFDKNTEFAWVKETPKPKRRNLKVFGDIMAEETSLNGRVVLFFNNQVKLYKGPMTFDGFQASVHSLKYPKMTFINSEFYQKLGSKRMKIVLLFVKNSDDKIIRKFNRLSNHFNNQYYFVIIPEDSEHGEIVVEFKNKFLHLKGRDLENEKDIDLENNAQLRLVEMTYSMQTAKKFVMNEPFEFELGLNFLMDYSSRKLKPFLRNETLLSTTIEGTRIKVLNSDSYTSSIRVPGQNSLVLYHGGLNSDDQTNQFLDYMIELSNTAAMKQVNFFVINGEKNEIEEFFDDERPVLLFYAYINLHSPLIFNQMFSKIKILKMIKRANSILPVQDELKKIIFNKQ